MGYEHIEIELKQISKYPNTPCGDFFLRWKTAAYTTCILCDGRGHGIKANISATMYANYLQHLFNSNYSLRNACEKLLKILKNTDNNSPYAVFSVIRILNDGVVTVLSHDMPAPLFITNRKVRVLSQRKIETEFGELLETNCFIKDGEGIILMSDGVTQAGIGRGYKFGLGSEKLAELLSENISNLDISISTNTLYKTIPDIIYNIVKDICNNVNDDDISIALIHARTGSITTIFTGPPTNKENDAKYVREFILSKGKKIICGGTTANIVAKNSGREMKVDMYQSSHYTPPSYHIDGIDLAVEGAITLNQLYNILDADRNLMQNSNPVTKLYDYVMNSDKIVFYLGSVNSSDEGDIGFIQQGIKSRKEIVPLIADKLRKLGKLVVIENI
ncbi:MAG: SpoIIE family protein phosphatase [Bacteroidetes bacterium]|nr:SpoIIE family protein phosphatase [Bacteroidota bacterium]